MCYIYHMRICTKCGVEKLPSEFFVKDKHTGRLHAQCKDCYKEHRKKYYSEHYYKYHDAYLARAKNYRTKIKTEYREKMLEYLSSKSCVDCGEADIVVLELDHIDPTTKSFSISQAVRLGRRWDEVLEEIKKCQVLCSNCHKRRTAQQYGWYKLNS